MMDELDFIESRDNDNVGFDFCLMDLVFLNKEQLAKSKVTKPHRFEDEEIVEKKMITRVIPKFYLVNETDLAKISVTVAALGTKYKKHNVGFIRNLVSGRFKTVCQDHGRWQLINHRENDRYRWSRNGFHTKSVVDICRRPVKASVFRRKIEENPRYLKRRDNPESLWIKIVENIPGTLILLTQAGRQSYALLPFQRGNFGLQFGLENLNKEKKVEQGMLFWYRNRMFIEKQLKHLMHSDFFTSIQVSRNGVLLWSTSLKL